MRRLPILLLILGLIVGIAVPFFWASRVPIFLGAALLLAAGILTRSRWPVLASIAAAVALILAPGLINGWRNGQGIAWTAADDEDVLLAESGVVITKADEEPVLRARDARTGELKWQLKLPEEPNRNPPRIWGAGDTLLTTGFDETLRGVDAKTGKVRWEAPPAATHFAGVTDGENVALTRCPAPRDCQVESLSLADGTLRWKAPVAGGGEYLGVPLSDDSQTTDRPLWPASVVVIPRKPDDSRYDVRDLATGRVITSNDHGTDSTAILGDVLVRQTDAGDMTGTDVRSGRVLWTRDKNAGSRAARSPMITSDTLGLPEGTLVLGADGATTESFAIGDALRLLDPRTGKLTEIPVDLPPDVVDLVSSDQPDVSAPRTPAILSRDYEDPSDPSKVIADGHTYARDDVRNAYLTPTQVAFESDQRPWGTGLSRVIEVFDRKTGERLARFAKDEMSLRPLGGRFVIADGDPDDPAEHVVG